MTTESTLASAARRALRAAAHHLDPVVMIGDKGLTAAVLHEIDIALSAHALIKVRVQSDDREQRVGFMNDICAKLGCESVQHLGKLLVLWRNKEDGDAAALDDDDEVSDRPAATARGPRRKLPDSAPRTRAPAGAARAPTGAARGRPSGSYAPRGEGFSREGGGYGRSDSTGAPRGAGTGAPRGGAAGGYSRGGADTAARGAPSAGRMTGDAQNRRFRRGDDAPPTDTRTPREGTAPRGRRGAARIETNDRSGDADNRGGFDSRGSYGGGASGDANADRRGLAGRSSYGNSAARPAPRSGGYGGADRGGGYGGADRGGSGGGYGGGDSQRRAPSGEGRWGQRGDAGAAPAARPRGAPPRGGAGGGAGAAPKPRARRRLG
jgi:RNA-binding protein